jgi:sugar phosphate isomerase/epimerase
MEKGDYKIENVYQGGYSSLDPNKAYSNSFTGYRTNAGSLGLTTDPRTANQIKDASAKLSSGVKQIELALVSSELFDSIPKQQFAEMRELSKLTGVNISVHAPVIDSAGMSQQGFSELNRELAERKITDALIRSHELNPSGNIPVTFHSAEGIAGSEWKTLGDVEGKKPREAKRLIGVDKESGKMIQLELEKKYYPMRYDEKGEKLPVSEKGEIYTPEENLKLQNTTVWDNQLSQLFFNKERADDILQQNYVQIQHLMKDLKSERITINDLTPSQQSVYLKARDAENYLDEVRKNTNTIFSKAYEHGTEEQRRALKAISGEFVENVKKQPDAMGMSRATSIMLDELKNPTLAPEMFVSIEKFATKQSAKTFGNAAFNAYSKFKDPNKTPLMVIENPPAGFGLSTGEDLKNLVIESRNQFVEKAKEKGMNEREAEKIAEKLIGATWDVGHINMLRKQGFKDQDIIRETEKIAPYVKHVHLSDNFGFEHTELPMGMGNVPMKEIMEKLGEKGFEGKKIIEAGQWWQHFQTNPLKESMEGLGSPMYSVGGGPNWNQSLGFYQNYSSGYGMMLPSNNYQTFGAGFSQLPQELGGEVTRAGGGRFSQRGME